MTMFEMPGRPLGTACGQRFVAEEICNDGRTRDGFTLCRQCLVTEEVDDEDPEDLAR